ncbi:MULTISPECIES: hypothetical protein [Sanguibacteroides]|uniref:Uncharacterized protein n=1 Tax=Sanguibacteroides justesenii TaxID=1547597 RepID=A0A0C3RFL2_9PORP|nr:MULTISPECIES: hypothetical protein [Sanguibacteroides]KIO44074.1 hypothetical protein BA92_11900 [Sanguibacteroides justesenii]KIO47267.1 hypothetical protein IE90_01350 [Sanguibacteroides justesenii]
MENILKEKTITEPTAMVNTEYSGGRWEMNLVFDLSVEAEWNVYQESPLISRFVFYSYRQENEG